jgi:hypothetical protein
MINLRQHSRLVMEWLDEVLGQVAKSISISRQSLREFYGACRVAGPVSIRLPTVEDHPEFRLILPAVREKLANPDGDGRRFIESEPNVWSYVA